MTYPFVVGSFVGDEAELPAMYEVRQHFDVLPAVDVLAALAEEWPRAKAPLSALASGASIAVAVGSRGIADIAVLVRGIVERLRAAGCEPFVVPAMGSHGGATAAGQTEVLAHLGVTETAVGAPVRATMDVASLGEVEGIPLLLDRFAWEADGIVLLILDDIGEDISGVGLDPNVTGRNVISWSARRERPRVLRIFARGLSAASNGNAKGIGNADAVAVRLVDALDGAKTAVNGLTSCSPDDVRIPLVFACDRDAVFAMLTTIRPTTPDDVRVIYARNTLDVARLWVSTGCLARLPAPPAVAVDPAPAVRCRRQPGVALHGRVDARS